MIYLCDFEDSFTYNIFADLVEQGQKVEIIPFKDVFKFLQTKINSSNKEVIILGPGPGHPKEYDFLISSIQALINRKNLLLVGVCLGHQLIWSSMGYKVTHANMPIHGQTHKLQLNSKWKNILNISDEQLVGVQQYNSLTVKLLNSEINSLACENHLLHCENNELLMAKGDGYLSYQFHPESVGTSCPKCFYSPIEKFLL